MTKIKCEVVVITGATADIGCVTAQLSADRGAHIAPACQRIDERAIALDEYLKPTVKNFYVKVNASRLRLAGVIVAPPLTNGDSHDPAAPRVNTAKSGWRKHTK